MALYQTIFHFIIHIPSKESDIINIFKRYQQTRHLSLLKQRKLVTFAFLKCSFSKELFYHRGI